MKSISPEIIERAKVWLSEKYDTETRTQVQELIDNNPDELLESFYKNLEFGTGGLRGIMGVGTNRMNTYTVAMATQGFANYIKKMFPDIQQPQIAIAYDCRNNSKEFAKTSAEVMSANGIKVYIFNALRPTPELSFAIRELKCQAGIVITASHNPKEYNGYKAYWEDGGQLVSPHDKNVIAEVEKITNFSMVNFNADENLIEYLDEKFDDIYINKILNLSLTPECIKKQQDLVFVYTPIHGTGGQIIPKLFKKAGFKNIHCVEEQMIVDGNFTTVVSPNPEEKAALTLAIEKAKKVNADVVLATDPDADRVGIAVKDENGEFVLLNGNQTAALLTYYLLTRWNELGKLSGNEYIVKTIVTTELLFDMANKYNVKKFDVLTGFKFIADTILNNPNMTFIGGGEESYGFLIGDFVRDKDANSACYMVAEIAAWAAEQNKTLYQILKEIYIEFGFYKEGLLSLTKKGISGSEEIKNMMLRFRNEPPKEILGSKIVMIKDYKTSICKDITTNREDTINLPKSDVLQFFTEDGTKISIRPSGTEPKIKFYFGTKARLENLVDFEVVDNELNNKINNLIKLFSE
ncbi:MAG: phospho-sugar mutase [Bacteroidales bacterium]|nr:phospho-sugar mutase [Bacteroidales bacterium]